MPCTRVVEIDCGPGGLAVKAYLLVGAHPVLVDTGVTGSSDHILAALAREGYDFLLRLRTLNGLRRGDSGRHLDPSTLTKLERAQLANVFDVVRTVQQIVQVTFPQSR